MRKRNRETIDQLLLHCPVAQELWTRKHRNFICGAILVLYLPCHVIIFKELLMSLSSICMDRIHVHAS